MSNKIFGHLKVLSTIVIVCGGLAWLFLGNTAPEFVPEASSKALSLLATLLLIALFVERSVEVYIGAMKSPQIATADAKLTHARRDVASFEATISERKAELEKAIAENQPSELIELKKKNISELTKVYDEAIETLRMADVLRQDLSGETRQTALICAVFLGIIVATVGPRVLTEMTEPMDDLDGIRRWVFITIDIFITGGLIGGGSDGIHKIISVATEKLDQIKGSIRAAT